MNRIGVLGNASRHHAGRPATRQGTRTATAAVVLAAALLALAPATPAAHDAAASGLDMAQAEQGSGARPDDEAERRYRERRQIDGRLDTIDRQLAPYEREKLRADPPPGAPDAGRLQRNDPVQQRLELERRDLQWRQRQLGNPLPQPPLDRSIGDGTGRR